MIKKKLSVCLPETTGSPDNADNVAVTQIISLATLNGIATSQIPSFIEAIGDRNLYNPVATWITSTKWDGHDRWRSFFDTLTCRDDYPVHLKTLLMRRWLLSAVAAVTTASGFRTRGVLTLQGPQSIGKTAWVRSLVPDFGMTESFVKLDHHLDAGNKDSLISAISHWIVEIGELDSSFKKDIARLKGFLTADHDKVRRPYGRADSTYPRRTVFCATVNDPEFLVDATGNSRWWTLAVERINYHHGINMQQLFAQCASEIQEGELWWLSAEEEKLLDSVNSNHRLVSVIREQVVASIDCSRRACSDLPAMTPTELLKRIGIKNPNNPQCKECAAILRELLGEPKRINGQNKWRIPLARSKEDEFIPVKANPLRGDSMF